MKHVKYDIEEIAKLIKIALDPNVEELYGFEEWLDSQKESELGHIEIPETHILKQDSKHVCAVNLNKID